MTSPSDPPVQPDAELGQRSSNTPVPERESRPTLRTAGAPPLPASPVVPAFADYDLLEELGRGGMGIVYKAHDRKRQRLVALKTMQGMDARSLLRFKQEFRSLAGLSHPNLVSLYELTGDSRHWFFTMELVEGVSFLHYVRGPATLSDEHPTLVDEFAERSPGQVRPARLQPDQLARLRGALAQLAAGVHFLHQSGKLHRDVKPGNVLVTPQGRVVLLDFGLAAELDRQQLHCSLNVLGTVAYMAPEQGARQPVSPACDWYAIGVMLYEALTGLLPFDGDTLDVLQRKLHFDPEPPSTFAPGTPDDLSTLCMELLRRDPQARPCGSEVLRRLSLDAATPSEIGCGPQRLEVPLIGRQQHLHKLTEALAQMRGGQTVLIDVEGRSGAGKSALVQRFVDDLRQDGEAVILMGRCYEQESVPYKALDSLVDALSRYLESLPAPAAQAVAPRDLATLARVFPVLRRLDTLVSVPRRQLESPDPREVRRRALGALRELLARLGDRRPLILIIDDLQWGDEDSAALLTELLRPPDPPILLLLLCYRSEDRESSPCLRELGKIQPGGGLHRHSLPVEPLTAEERRELALALLDPRDETAAAQAESIARQSGGYPFFVYELVQYVQGGPACAAPSATGKAIAEGVDQSGDLSLSEVLWARIVQLPEDARRLLEVVAVASRPLPQSDACQAAEIVQEHAVLACLRAGRLLRSTGPGEHGEIETYHDRIRETVLLHLDAATLQRYHRGLAAVLEASGRADPELLAVHLAGAGEQARSGHYYALAAAQAAETLAFDRAAKLYRFALELLAPQGEDERHLRTKLGDALANAGRGAESARAYLSAIVAVEPAEQLELQRRAALQFLRSGHIDDGLATLRTVLAAIGEKLVPTPRRVFWRLAWQRLRLMLCRLRHTGRSADQINPGLLRRLDVSQSAALGLSMVDTLQGAYFQSRSLLLALKAGEPERLVTALAIEAAHLSVEGQRSQRQTQRYFQAADALARQSDKPYPRALVLLARGMAAALAGEWREGARLCDEAELLLRESCTGALWELGTAHRFALWPLMLMGEVVEINRRLPRLLKEARERDDLYEETNLSLVIRTFTRLAADEPQRARGELAGVMEKWSHQGFHVQHMNRLIDEAQLDLYEGDGASGWRWLTEAWPDLQRSHLLHVQQVRVMLLDLRARCALAQTGGKDEAEWLRHAERDARSLRRERTPWAEALANLLESAIAHRRGHAANGKTLLNAALSGFTAVRMQLHAAVTRRRMGQIQGHAQGQELLRQAEEWMKGQTIRNVHRMTALLAPGWRED